MPLTPSNILPSKQLRNSREWLAEADRIVSKSLSVGSFNRETQALFESAMSMVAATRMSSYSREQYNANRLQRDSWRNLDPATLAFFGGQQPSEALVSECGGRLEKRSVRGAGAVLELRDVGSEQRIYAGLNTGTGSQGADVVPIGFVPSVFHALRMIDGLFNAAKWLITPTGNVMDVPSAIETNVGETLAEASPVGQSNPTFSQTQFASTPAWSSDQIVMSIAFLEDCGAPNAAELMAQIFAIRISLGLGGNFVTSLLNDAHVATTAASASTVTPAELVGLTGGVSNAAYAYKPTSGFLMNPATLTSLWSQTALLSGLFVYPRKFRDDGVPLLLEQPVFLCPNMPTLSTGAKAIAYGDMSRFLIRSVGDSFTTFRYLETYMAHYQTAFQAWWRAEGKLISADNGSSDFPIVLLQMAHS
jgi:HK97 family phage major capsid protein